MATIVFRTDSGTHIGGGHLSRCTALAKEFHKQGHRIIFIGRQHDGMRPAPEFAQEIILEGRFSDSSDLNNYKSWSGVPLKTELKQMQNIHKSIGPVNLLVVDHYSFDSEWQKAQLGWASKIAAIDDLMNRHHHSHFIIDHNLSASLERYKKLQSYSKAKYLLGPKYALIREEFQNSRPNHPQSIQTIKNIFIFLGTISKDRALRALNHLSPLVTSDRTVSFLAPGHDLQKEYFGPIKIIPFSSTIEQNYLEADLVIGAGGVSHLERCCLGVPTAIVKVADNQSELIKKAVELKTTIYLGEIDQLNLQKWQPAIEQLTLFPPKGWEEMAKNGHSLVDGMGVKRLCSELL